jgi:beta-glucosidase
LSYTDFAWEITGQDLGDVDGTIEVTVEVTNTGSAAGKDVVELYYSAPYTAGGIEKSSVVLGAFAKTGLIAPGASESVTLTLAVEDMASYDYVTAKAYVLEEGDYAITIQTDSHNIKAGLDPITYTVDSTVVYSGDNHRASDASAVTNAFDDVSALITQNMSRADFAGTFPTSPTTADLVAPDAIIEAFQAYDPAANADPDAEMPTTGASNGLSLIDMRGLAWDDPAWELYLDQLTVDEMLAVIDNGAYNTAAVESAGKPATFDSDGPAGINNFMTGASGVAYPSEVVIASTWNVELAEKMGVMIGNEALSFGMSGWYAPAMNTHRSQFAGRNFEYYSEDGLLAGNIATAVVEGAAQKGVYCNIKHFAVNDQETNRVNNGVSSQLNEQALREIYLKPFELVIKNATMELKYISDSEGTVTTVEVPAGNAVMSSFNRIGGTWAGGSYALMTTVLRDEWGFQGFAITDFNLYDYMYVNQGIAAGTDLMLTFSSMKQVQDTTSATAVTNLREAMHNIMFTVANSNAVNGIAPGAIISYTMATWQKVLIAVDIALALLVAAGFALVFLKGKKKGEAEAEAAKA